MKQNETLNFDKIKSPIYVGQDFGKQVRSAFDFEKLDKEVDREYSIYIPDSTEALTSSFFNGCFAKSVANLGSREAFFEHYSFKAPEHIVSAISVGVDRALLALKKRSKTSKLVTM